MGLRAGRRRGGEGQVFVLFDLKRIAYLLFLVLLVGLVLVQLRTTHMKRVYEMTALVEQERRIEQAVWEQQVRLSGLTESPQQVKKQLERVNVGVCPLGEQPQETATVARGEQ